MAFEALSLSVSRRPVPVQYAAAMWKIEQSLVLLAKAKQIGPHGTSMCSGSGLRRLMLCMFIHTSPFLSGPTCCPQQVTFLSSAESSSSSRHARRRVHLLIAAASALCM